MVEKSHINRLEAPTSLSWMVLHHSYVLTLTMSYPSWQLSTHHGNNTILSASPGAWPVHKTSFITWWTGNLTTVMVWLGLQMSSMARIINNMTDASTYQWKSFVNMALCSMVENVLSNTHLWPSLDIYIYDKDGALTNPCYDQCSEQNAPKTPTQVHSLAFASKALTSDEQQYAKKSVECLPVSLV